MCTTQDDFTVRMNDVSLKHKLDSYSYSLHMSSSKLLENTSKKLEKLAMLEQCGQIKAALESPAGCERVGNYGIIRSLFRLISYQIVCEKRI